MLLYKPIQIVMKIGSKTGHKFMMIYGVVLFDMISMIFTLS